MDSTYTFEVTKWMIPDKRLPELEVVFDAAGAHGGPVVIHFHGGLVSREVAEAGAAVAAPFYLQVNAFRNSSYMVDG